MRKNNPRNDGHIFQAWCGPEYKFVLGDDGVLHLRPHRDPWVNYKLLEQSLIKLLGEREFNKQEYFGQLHPPTPATPMPYPEKTGRLTASQPRLCPPLPGWHD